MSLPDNVHPEGHRNPPHGYKWVRRFLNFVPSETGIKIVNVYILEPTDVRVPREDPGLVRE